MRWNKRKILLAEEWKRVFSENASVVFTDKPSCLSEPYVVFEMEKKEKENQIYTGTHFSYFLKLFSFILSLSNISAVHLKCNYFTEGNGTPLQYSCLENPTDGGPGGL